MNRWLQVMQYVEENADRIVVALTCACALIASRI